MQPRTYTADEIARAVMTYGEGCRDGKVTFLRDALGIEPPVMTREVTLRVTLTVPSYDDSGEENDDSHVASGVSTVLREYLYNVLAEFSSEDQINDAEVEGVFTT
jgi:hypothetical protein